MTTTHAMASALIRHQLAAVREDAARRADDLAADVQRLATDIRGGRAHGGTAVRLAAVLADLIRDCAVLDATVQTADLFTTEETP